MSKQKVIVQAVIEQGLSKTEAALRYGVSRQWVHELLNKYRLGGLDAVQPRSRGPKNNPRSTSAEVASRILALRHELQIARLDAGPVTIAWHLDREGLRPPSTSTDVTISDATTGEIIRELTIDPNRDYQPRTSGQRKTPRSEDRGV